MMGRWRWLIAGALEAMGLVALAGCSGPNPVDEWLSDMNPPTPSEAARDAFNVYDPDLRRRSVNLLSNADWGGDPAYMKAYRLLVDDPDPTVRCASLRALGRHGDAQDIPRGVIYLKDSSPYVRWESALMLQRLHGDAAVEPLLAAMRDDEDGDVRAACAYALAQYTQPKVFQAIVGALSDEDYAVVWQAARSLRVLTGQKLGNDGAAWLAWAEKSEQHLFDQHEHYTWMEYIRKPTVFDRMEFWKIPKKAQPQEPRGLVIAAEDTAATSPPPPAASAPAAAPTPAPAAAPAPAAGADKPYDITKPASPR